MQWDAIAQFYPWRVFYARSMRSGHIPLWNPHQFCGTPFLANGQSACLYPPNLIFLIFDPITAYTIFAALHLFLAQLFMYWLMRELGAKELGGIVAGIVFAFSAFMVLWLELPTFVSVAVWLPLALLLVQRAVSRRSAYYGMLTGLTLGLTFLAGHFQIAFYVVLATGLFWLWKIVEVWRAEGKTYTFLKVIVPLAACVVIAGLIAAPQVLPTQELAANSHRVRQVTEDGYRTFVDNALPVYRLVTAFAPGFFGDPSRGDYYLLGSVEGSRHFGSAADYMEYGMYAGILPLMLALIALGSIRRKHVGYFAVLTLLALLTATGTPINRLFYFGMPGFSALGGPNRILLLYLFAIAALAGFGADSLPRGVSRLPHGPERARLLLPVMVATAGTAVILAVTLHLGRGTAETMIGVTVSREILRDIASPLFAVALFGLSSFLLLLQHLEKIPHWTCSLLVVVIVVLDLFAFGINYNPTCERSKVYPETKLTTELKRLTANGERIAPINPKWSLFETPKDAILPPNAAMVYGLYDVQGYDSLYTRAYKDLSSRIQGIDSSPPENGNMVLIRRLTDGVRGLAQYVVTSDPAGAAIITARKGTSLFWESDVSSDPAISRPSPRVTNADAHFEGPNRIVFRVNSTELSDHITEAVGARFVFCPGWTAETCEIPLSPEERDRPFMAASIGNLEVSEVTFKYEPYSFRLGLFLMLVGVGAISCAGVYRVARHRSVK